MADELQSDDKAVEGHIRTYEGFLGILKWGVVAVAVLLIAMAIFLVPRG